MSYVSYTTESPYAATPQTAWHIGMFKFRNIPAASDDHYIIIDAKYNNRPDLLAYDLYNNPMYWWIFMIRNMDIIRDPVWDFTTGKEILVPSSKHLKATLG